MSSLREPDGIARENQVERRRERVWIRFEGLLEKVERAGPTGLDDKELRELGRLYRAVTTNLSQARSFGASTRRMDYLNRLVTRGHAALYGRSQKGSGWRTLVWSPLVFPEVVRKTWPFHLAALLILLAGATYGYLGAVEDPEWSLEILPGMEHRTPFASRDELRETLLHGRPGQPTEIGEGEKAFFASFLWQHNTRVGALAFFSGFLAGIPTVLLVLYNGLILGVYSAAFHRHDLAFEWWAWILPHGVTEFLAIVLLSGGGLLIGYRVIAPGNLSRARALRQIRGQVLHILVFAFPMFLIAAAIESWVRQSGISDPTRYAFAAATAILWTCYLLWGKVPESVRDVRSGQTVAEEWVPMPSHEELLAGLGFFRGRQK